jgi:uncharacterized membrane protein (UPF0127 family)
MMTPAPAQLRSAVLAALLVAGGSCGADRASGPPAGPEVTPLVTVPTDSTRVIPLSVGGHTIRVELATTSSARARGLMGRQQLPDSAGMLFVFARDGQLGFWMKDTPIDLSIAFLDAERRIVNIEQMDRFDDRTTHFSAGPARYALEVNRGWFAARGISAGDRVAFTLPTGLRIDP